MDSGVNGTQNLPILISLPPLHLSSAPYDPSHQPQNAFCYLRFSRGYPYQHSFEQSGRRRTDGEYRGVRWRGTCEGGRSAVRPSATTVSRCDVWIDRDV